MLLSLRVNNCLIYNSEVEFSMQADMRYKRFPSNVAKNGKVNVLKAAVLIGPNNSGKTNFVRIVAMLKKLMLNQDVKIGENLFSDDPIAVLAVSFVQEGSEYLFEMKHDVRKQEYIYERFAQIYRDKYNNSKEVTLLLRDSINKEYYAEVKKISD